MINFNRIGNRVTGLFPEIKDSEEPFYQLLDGMKTKKTHDVAATIRMLRTEVYPIIRQEIQLGRAAAIHGVRSRSIDMILYGLVSEILDVDSKDHRDIIVETTLSYGALKFLGKKPDDVLNSLILTLEGHEVDFLKKYLSRADHLKTPESMGYKIITNPEFAFVKT